MLPLVMSCVLGSSQVSSWLCLSESRCDKDLDTLSGYALCLPNLARLQTYRFAEHRPILCVEIKVSLCQGEGGAGQGNKRPDCEAASLLPGVNFTAQAIGIPHIGPHGPFPAPSSHRLGLLPAPSVTCTLVLCFLPLARPLDLGPFLVL